MPCRLRKEEIVTIETLCEHGVPMTEIARQLGVVEGTVRYHRRRAETGCVQSLSHFLAQGQVSISAKNWGSIGSSPRRSVHG